MLRDSSICFLLLLCIASSHAGKNLAQFISRIRGYENYVETGDCARVPRKIPILNQEGSAQWIYQILICARVQRDLNNAVVAVTVPSKTGFRKFLVSEIRSPF